MARGDEHITWDKTGNDTWQTGEKRAGLYVGNITYTNTPGPGAEEYELVVNPGAVSTTTHVTLHGAKDSFRKFLFDKPPAV